VKGARGDAKELAELPIPGKYRRVPQVAPDSRYNVSQLYSRLAESIRNDKPTVSIFSGELAKASRTFSGSPPTTRPLRMS